MHSSSGILTTASMADTSEESKRHSEQVLQDLGGSDTQQATRDKPISKNAAEELYGSRAVAG